MKNILGTTDSLELLHKNGELGYDYFNDSGDWEESTYDDNGKERTYKNSAGYSWECTYDDNGNERTYKDSDGVMRGFDTPEYTMEEIKEMLGKEFKIKL